MLSYDVVFIFNFLIILGNLLDSDTEMVTGILDATLFVCHFSFFSAEKFV